ncbi:MAG: quinone-dependent dihydroorotate dehydrogenase [Verrucomicrobia bacterium]|nr:quinone-dependent dihydroorotate dehydrogenase [Verrucomicrobiota bacterium]MDE3098241.1 quinone-dependent dihydroorotate dehydrogenase [Verrucomicrobiota bacterium]
MSWLYQKLARPVLFAQDAGRAHDFTLNVLARAAHSRAACGALSAAFGAPPLPVSLFNLAFPNPVGLAAGMDKAAAAVPIWEKLGLGFCELGAVTWLPQDGNPPPRVFRAVADRAIVNRMGFNNPGAQAVARALEAWRKSGRWPGHPVGVNLGKSKLTPLENAASDYANSFRVLRGLADFFVVNVSSPNTPGLRELQNKPQLDEILAAIQEIQSSGQAKPILVKIAPDLSLEAVDEIIELAQARGIAGIIATNTTLERPPSAHAATRRIYDEPGGLSGAPLRRRSTEIVRHIFRRAKGTLPVIGVGGIFNADDAWEKFAAGAALIQVYTGLVYEGPAIARAIVKGLIRKMRRAGIRDLKEIAGSAPAPS